MNTPRSRALPPGVVPLLLLSLLLSAWIALRVPLLDPDEGRNAEVAREMAVDGDVVIPHLAGMPYLDKPPLLFAAAAASIRLLGHTPFAARLPAMLAALATLLLLARASARIAPPGHAARAVALTLSAPLFAVLAAYVIFDMPLAACVTAVWTGIAREPDGGPGPARRAGIYLAVALGVLDKGPVMLAWAIGGSLAAALLARSRAPLRWLAWWPGWTLVVALAGGWFALALRRHPEYAHYAFLEETAQRLTTNAFHRAQGPWFVPAVLVGGALPWSLLTPWRAPASYASRVAAGFVLFAAVFFALSRSQLVTYLLPAIPALAWWAAEAWGHAGRARVRLAAIAATALWAGVLLAAEGPLGRFAHDTSGAGLAAAIREAGNGTVTYDDCYSPGSDYLRGRISNVVSRDGGVLTSNYVIRYRERLQARGLWRLYDSPDAAPRADVVVRPARPGGPPVAAADSSLYADARFRAWRTGP